MGLPLKNVFLLMTFKHDLFLSYAMRVSHLHAFNYLHCVR